MASSLYIYLDDCIYSHRLADALRNAGYGVTTPAQAGTTGKPDPDHFRFAKDGDVVILTYNAKDFIALHEADPTHPGIMVVYQETGRAVSEQSLKHRRHSVSAKAV